MIRKVALVPNTGKSGALRCASRVAQILKNHGIESCAEPSRADMFAAIGCGVTPIEQEELFKACDAAVVFGGDGTVLSVAKRAAEADIPIVGVNFGHVGYITELEEGEVDMISRLATGDYRLEKRMMLDVSISKAGKQLFFSHAFNEAAITRGIVTRLADFSVSCDGDLVSNYRADGLIIATPTGSTAYSMAAGGPVIDPSVEVISTTPICSHSLDSARSLIFGPNSVIKVSIPSARRAEAVVTVDGRAYFRINDSELSVTISKSQKYVSLIRLKNVPFATTLLKKFGAGKQGQKGALNYEKISKTCGNP